MTIDKVIEAGQFDPEFVWKWSALHWYSILFIIIFIMISIFIIFLSIDLHERSLMPFGFVSLFIVAVILFSNCFYTTEFNKGKWENEYVKPYYNSINKEKHEIVFVKIDPEISNKTTGSVVFGSGYITTDTERLTPLVVSYKDNGKVITHTNWLDTQMVLTNSDKPYIEFKRVPRDLGHDYLAGIYEVKVYLPEGYKFTDIK